ncbi:MAG TPA: fumarylacetoacetate hydrolase family protein [Anaerolineales bacterium]|nr:fumarylacetoacetate hydrolase family protein [Anaerolineales bacterium]
MRVIRFLDETNQPRYGWVFEDQVGLIEGDIFGAYQREEAELPISEVKLLAPIVPGKVICVGRNYAAHAEEHDAEVPPYPLIFLKPTTSLVGPGAPVVLPPQSKQVEHEGELAAVIGKQGKWLTVENALDVVFGYTIANDVTARDLQRQDGQWTRGKGFDTFCPVGPWIDTEFNPIDTMVSCHVNGELRQMATTRDMIFSISQILVFISSVMTLEPGDLILTGTPAGVGPLSAGDQVSVSIERLGELSNPIIAESR